MELHKNIIGHLCATHSNSLARDIPVSGDYTGYKDGTEPVFPLENQLEWPLPGQTLACGIDPGDYMQADCSMPPHLCTEFRETLL